MSLPSVMLTYRGSALHLNKDAKQQLLGSGAVPQRLQLLAEERCLEIGTSPRPSGLKLGRGWTAVRDHLRLKVRCWPASECSNASTYAPAGFS